MVSAHTLKRRKEEMSNNNNEMKKELGMGAAMATVVGCVIGSGVFFKPTAIYTATGGAPGLAIIAWVVTSLVCLCAAMTFAEIAILIPETGGMPVYLKRYSVTGLVISAVGCRLLYSIPVWLRHWQ